MNTQFFKVIGKKGKAFLVKHSADILTGFTACGVVLTGYEAHKATLKAENYLRINGYDEANPDTQKVLKWQSRKNYILPVAIGGATIGAALGANLINHHHIAGLAAACTVAETALSEHRDKLEELMGEKALKKVDEELSLEKAQAAINEHRNSLDLDNPAYYEMQLCCETYCTNRPFPSSRARVERALNNYNNQVMTLGGAVYRTFIEDCGGTVSDDHVSNFEGHGRYTTGPLILEFSSGIDEETGRTYLAICPKNPPIVDYDRNI